MIASGAIDALGLKAQDMTRGCESQQVGWLCRPGGLHRPADCKTQNQEQHRMHIGVREYPQQVAGILSPNAWAKQARSGGHYLISLERECAVRELLAADG